MTRTAAPRPPRPDRRDRGADEGCALTPRGVTSDTIELGDLDSYTFSANAGDTIQLSMTDVVSGPLVPAVTLYLPNGGLLSSTFAAGLTTVAVVAPSPGEYTVVVYDWSSGAASSGDYTLDFQLSAGP